MKNSLKCLMTAIFAGTLLSCASSNKNSASLTPAERQKIAKEAYIYGYPLVLTDMSRRVSTNVSKADAQRAPVNQFTHRSKLPDANSRESISPDVDTLASSAFLDLSKGPMILSVPNTRDRYYSVSMYDAYTNVFSTAGTRSLGNDKKDIVLVGPEFKGEAPNDLEKVEAPTNLVRIVIHTKAGGAKEVAAANALQKKFTLTPLSEWRRVVASISSPKVDPFVDTSTPAAQQVADLDGVEFFRRMAELMKENPPTEADAALVADLKKIGILPGESLRTGPLSDEVKADLIIGAREGQKAIIRNAQEAAGRPVNGWVASRQGGQFKGDYVKRASIAMFAWNAPLAADVWMARASVDVSGDKLSGVHSYVLRFSKEQKPPVRGFWSLTAYNKDQMLVKNSLNRYAIGERSNRLKFADDGSLTLYLQTNNPGPEKQSNWLPIPAEEFSLVMRMYWPDGDAMKSWKMPSVHKATMNTNLADSSASAENEGQ